MGRRVVVEVPYLHRWFAVDPVQDSGSLEAGCVDGTGTRLRSTTYPLISWAKQTRSTKEEYGERTVAAGFAIDRACMHTSTYYCLVKLLAP